MRNPGGAGGAGVYQTIINHIPPHDTFIATHLGLGGGDVLERKLPAALSIGIDIDPEVIRDWKDLNVPGLDLHCTDVVNWLKSRPFNGREFVYVTPPYGLPSRRGTLYQHQYTDIELLRLLKVLSKLPCPVMVSSYSSEIYDRSPLARWRTIIFKAKTQGDSAIKHLWMNYPEPTELHDLRYVGRNFRERDRIKRKAARWKARLAKLDPLERAAIMQCLLELQANVVSSICQSQTQASEVGEDEADDVVEPLPGAVAPWVPRRKR